MTTSNLSAVESFPYNDLEESLLCLQSLYKPELSKQFQIEQALRWRSGELLSKPAQQQFILALLKEDADHHNEVVRWVRPFMKDLDCYKLCRRLIDAAHKTEEEGLWPLYIQAIIGSPFQIKELANQLERKGDADPMTALDIVEILKREQSPEAIDRLHHWSQNSKQPEVARACRQALEELAQEQATSVDELLQAELPALYIGVANTRCFDYTPRTITAHLNPDLTLSYLDSDSRVYTSVPPVRDSDDQGSASRACEELTGLMREVKRCVKSQSAVLESAMCHGRRWPVPLWRKRFLIHPVMRGLSLPLVFAVQTTNQPPQPFMVHEGSFINADKSLVELPANGFIRLLHPARLDPDQRERWSAFVGKMAPCAPPFEQLKRSVFSLNTHRDTWLQPERMLGKVSTRRLSKTKRQLGYTGSLSQGGISIIERDYGPYQATLHFELDTASSRAVVEHTARCTAVRVLKMGQPVNLDALPPCVFSEVTWDLHRLNNSSLVASSTTCPNKQ